MTLPKAGAVLLPLLPLSVLIAQGGVGIDTQQTLYLYGAPLLSYGLFFIAYQRRDKMFKV